MKSKKLGSENVLKLVFKLGIPAMIGMMTIAFYNVVDTYFISSIGTEAVGTASVVFPISMIVSGVAFAFGSGAGSSISRLLGEDNVHEASRTGSIAFFSALLLAGGLALTTGIFFKPVLEFFGATDEIMPYAYNYGLIILVGAVINAGTVTANNMIRAEGFAKTSMITMLIGSGVNMVLDPIFIFTLGLGIKGAALATVTAQSIALVYALLFYIRGNTSVKLSIQKFNFDLDIYKEVLKIGIPVFIYQFLSSLSIGIINNQAADFGTEAVAAMGITTKILAFMSYIVFGFVKGLQPIAGYNFGAGFYQRLKEALRYSALILTVYCVVAGLGVFAFRYEIIGVFTEDSKVFFMAEKALKYWSLSFILLGFQMTYITAFLALGKAKEGSILGLSRQGLILIPLIFIFKAFMGFNGIVLAQSAADILTFIMSLIFAGKLNKELFSENIKSEAAINNIR